MTPSLKQFVTALCLSFLISLPALAQSDRLDTLFDQLGEIGGSHWQQAEREIWSVWSKSGSDAMDLLLERGRAALNAGDYDAAIEHLTALTDHAPDFAEGWNARATAYFKAGLYGPSLADIRHTLALNPRHFGAISGLGMILENLGYPEQALNAFRQVQAIHPNRPDLKGTIERLEKEVGGTDL